MAWAGKILRVNLTAGTCTAEPLNMQWARDYIGQRGLATKYFVEEVDAKVDPLSADNKIIWATGPLTGTMASTGGRYSVITKGALTGAIACSNSGGYWGAELKMAGWDMIIFEGKSAKPVYLVIENNKAELHDAAFIWGKSVWETEPAIKARHQEPQMRVSSIGRAGETGLAVSFVCADTETHFALIEKRQGMALVREHIEGFEPVDVATPMAIPVGPNNGGIKGKRPSKKDKLRAAAAQASAEPTQSASSSK